MSQNSNTTVSVIIPTYNRAHLVGRAIHSALAQTFPDFEVIVVDDGSKDDTEQVVRSFNDQRIVYHRHQVNRGVSAARNTGFSLARGAYIALLDSDDLWLPHKLERQLEVFSNSTNSSLGVVYTWGMWVHEDNGHVDVRRREKRGRLFDDFLKQSFSPMTPTLMIKRECIEAVGGFDERMPFREDRDFALRLASQFQFDLVPEYLVVVFFDGKRNLRVDHAKRQVGLEIFLNKTPAIQENPKIKSSYLRELALAYAQLGDREQWSKYIRQSLRTNPGNLPAWKSLLGGSLMGLGGYKKLGRIKRRLRGALWGAQY